MLVSHQVEAAMRCDGPECRHSGAGHRVSPMQAAVAAATPSSWRDAVVVTTRADGWITLASVDSDEPISVWHHTERADLVPGDPVALHSRYRLLAVGSERVSILSLQR